MSLRPESHPALKVIVIFVSGLTQPVVIIIGVLADAKTPFIVGLTLSEILHVELPIPVLNLILFKQLPVGIIKLRLLESLFENQPLIELNPK